MTRSSISSLLAGPRSCRAVHAALAATLVVAGSLPASAAPYQEAYLKAAFPRAVTYFGSGVAIDGDTAVVGAYGDWSNASGINGDESNKSMIGAGSAHVFVRQDGVWTRQAYLKSSSPSSSEAFGCCVAIKGDLIIVGTKIGKVHIFRRTGTTWAEDDVISGTTATAFGTVVAIEGDLAIIGDPKDKSSFGGVDNPEFDNTATDAGAVYVYAKNGDVWEEEAFLKAPHPDGKETNPGSVGDGFGSSLSISGGTLVVGASKEASSASGVGGSDDNNLSGSSGAAYVFTRNALTKKWTQQAYLKAANPDSGDAFGQTVSVQGDRILVGAPGEDSKASGIGGDATDNSRADSGAAYLFKRSGSVWTQEAYLKASNPDASDGFGHSVAVDGNMAVVGAWYENSPAKGINGSLLNDNTRGAHTGAAYAFGNAGTGWTQTAYLKASNARVYTQFSEFYAGLSNGTAIFGSTKEWSKSAGVNDLANQFDQSMSYSGAAYIFTGLGLVSDQGMQIATTTREAGKYGIDFTSAAGRTGWRVKGSSDLVNFSDDLTGGAVITETDYGVYHAEIDLSGAPEDRYFLRIDY